MIVGDDRPAVPENGGVREMGEKAEKKTRKTKKREKAESGKRSVRSAAARRSYYLRGRMGPLPDGVILHRGFRRCACIH